MFEKKLEADLKAIFGVKKVSYDQPGASQEQDCLFIDVTSPGNVISPGRATAKVSGLLYMFAPADKLTFGFFSKCIEAAPKELTANFFFSEIEDNNKRFQNIVQRSLSFIYFFDSQYDPVTGSITSVDITIEEQA